MLASRLRLQAVDGAAVVAAREGEGKGGNGIGIGVRSNQRWLQLRRARLHGLQVEDEGSRMPCGSRGEGRGEKRCWRHSWVVALAARASSGKRGIGNCGGSPFLLEQVANEGDQGYNSEGPMSGGYAGPRAGLRQRQRYYA
ncbi:hypothetical protein BHE74_00036879 [Ensete ventricosum]|nr:hypothetical protein BHE74_00036879 [Ensete ventricosum]